MAIPTQYENFTSSSDNSETLVVTVIPLEPHLNPYRMEVDVSPEVDKNLKQVFQHQKYWS